MAQIVEDFEDRNFTDGMPLTWVASEVSGSDDFVINERGELQSKGPSSTAKLAITSSFPIDFGNSNVSWTFKVRYAGGMPSGSNYVEVYLMTRSSPMLDSPRGYYVRMGESGSDDGIDLFSTAAGLIIEDTNSLVALDINANIRVSRSGLGEWTLEADNSGGANFRFIGRVSNQDFDSGDLFGLLVRHTSTRNEDFFFDDIVIEVSAAKDTVKPSILSVTPLNATTIEVVFSENIDESSAENSANYRLEGVEIKEAARDDEENDKVVLTTSVLENGQDYQLEVTGVRDLNGNVIEEATISFSFLVTSIPSFREVVINEIFANPISDPKPDDLTNDFIELFNTTQDKFFSLSGWTLEDNNASPVSLGEFILRPSQFVIVTRDTSAFSTEVSKIEASLPNFNNANDYAVLRSDDELLVDSVTYAATEDGISIEQINPFFPIFLPNNYGNSTANDGATPGAENTIFDDTPDTTAPTLLRLSVVSPTRLLLLYSEPVQVASAEDVDNYSIDGGVIIRSVRQNSIIGDRYEIVTSALQPNEERRLTVSKIKDLSGNTIRPNSTADFEFIETVPAGFGDVVVNELMADPTPSKGLPATDYVELLNTSSKFIELGGWFLKDNSTASSELFPNYILRPDSMVLICDIGFVQEFQGVRNLLGIDDFPNFNATSEDEVILLNSESEVMFELKYPESTHQDGISIELINPQYPCISISSYGSSLAPRGGSPGEVNSIFSNSPNTVSPKIVEVRLDSILHITFSEVMDALSLMMAVFNIPGLSIETIDIQEDFPTSIRIWFEEELAEGESYKLAISGALDCFGNPLDTSDISFGKGKIPDFNDLIITEIMYDPESSVVFPDREYIEIYNASESLLSLGGVVLYDERSKVILPDWLLQPHSYYLLTTTTGAQEFSLIQGVNSQNTIGISGFPSLSNSGEQLLLTYDQRLIHFVEYDPSWHTDANALEGGIALELVDVENPCQSDENNWGSSESENGGTPTQANSIEAPGSVSDDVEPKITNAVAIAPETVLIEFDELILPSSVHSANATFEGKSFENIFYFDPFRPKSISLVISPTLEFSIPIKLSLAGIRDCSGNEVEEKIITVALPEQPEAGEILLSEVLFNPRTNGVDFVELFNSSSKYLSIKGWQLARFDVDGPDDQVVISSNELVIPPSDFLALSIDSDLLLTNYPKGDAGKFFEMGSFPVYSNDTGNVVLLDHQGILQDWFRYEDGFHYSLLESTDGVSLERISYDSPTNDPNNWRSAASTENFATPGKANSQSLSTKGASVGGVTIDPEVFIPGDDGGRNFTTINYRFDEPGIFANVMIYDQNGRKVKTLAQGQLLPQSGFFTWNGDTDAGNLARLGYYVVLFEVYNANGFSETIKETVAVARHF